MVTVAASEIFPAHPPAEPEQAARWFREWFRDALDGRVEGFAAITGLDSKTGFSTGTASAKLNELLRTISEVGLNPLIFPGGGREANIYGRLFLLRERPPRRKRGGAGLAIWAPGFAMDLDVGEGKFVSSDDWLRLLRRMHGLGVGPSIIVDSGSGGGHAYWRVTGGMDPRTAEMVSKRMHVWVRSLVPGVHVDSMEDGARVMRLPGTLRFPKAGESAVVATVCRVRWVGGPEADLNMARFVELSAAAWAVEEDAKIRRAMVREERDMDARGAILRAEARRRAGGARGYWDRLMSLVDAEHEFAAVYSWDDILLPRGWKLIVRSDGSEADWRGRRTWMRPGGASMGKTGVSSRSLITDYVGDGGWTERAASLVSLSPETGLLRLHEAEIPLTKANVAAELYRGGDLGELLAEFIEFGKVKL